MGEAVADTGETVGSGAVGTGEIATFTATGEWVGVRLAAEGTGGTTGKAAVGMRGTAVGLYSPRGWWVVEAGCDRLYSPRGCWVVEAGTPPS